MTSPSAPLDGDRNLPPLARLWRVNWAVLLLAAGLAGAGVLALHSLSASPGRPLAELHAARFLLGLALLLGFALTPQRVWLGLAYPLYLVALLALAAVPFFGLEAMGARRWLGAGSLLLQPSEIMKVALVLALARYFQWLAPQQRSSPLWVLIALLLIAAPVVLTARQPDLGTAILLALTGLALMFLAGVHLGYFAAGAAGAAVAAPLLWAGMHDYQRKRLEVFLDPDKDPLGAGYHITQSKIALGSGGFSGKGLMGGTQSQLDFLPEKHTDFIFTVLAEEWGFTGALLLLALYAALFALLVVMAMRSRSDFGRLLIAPVAVLLTAYVTINVAMVTGLAPVVGVPLPLVSYGGSAMLSVMAALGLAMSAHIDRRQRIRREDMGTLW